MPAITRGSERLEMAVQRRIGVGRSELTECLERQRSRSFACHES